MSDYEMGRDSDPESADGRAWRMGIPPYDRPVPEVRHTKTVVIENRGELDAEDHEVCRACWEQWPCPTVVGWPRPVLIHEGVLETFGRVEWGKPDPEGFYTPSIREAA